MKTEEKKERTKKTNAGEQPKQKKKSKMRLYWDSIEGLEPAFEIMDMRAILK